MAIDVFLKIEGIEGESQDAKHKNEIDVISFSWGINNPERGRTRLEEFHVVKSIDLASPAIFDAVCSGDHIGRAELTIRKAGKEQQEFYKITMEEVLITRQTPATGTGDAVPMEQISLSFAKVEVNYRPQKADGSLGQWVGSSCSPRGHGGGPGVS
jgi:type VI secretion system secreted protein Hcp